MVSFALSLLLFSFAIVISLIIIIAVGFILFGGRKLNQQA